MAGGGAVAFADGSKEAVEEDDEINKIIREKTGNISASPATQQQPNTTVDSPGPTLKELDADLANRGITAETAQQKRITQAAPTEAAPVKDTKFDQMLAQYNQERPIKPATNVMQAAEPATEGGINTEQAPDASALKALREQAAGYKTTMDKSVPQLAKEQQNMYTQMGIVNPAIAEQAGLKERKATVENDSRDMAKTRLIQFLVDWGKTPGSTIKGAINAGSNLIENSVGDDKLRRKMLNDLDAVGRDITKSEYLRQIGEVDKATTIQKEAGAKYYTINEKILEYNAKVELQQMKIELAAAKGANVNGVVQQAEILYKGMVAKGRPEGDVTRRDAMIEALNMQPSITSAGISAASQQAIATPKAQTDADKAATALAEERRKQQKDFGEALSNELRARRKDLVAAAKVDKDAGIATTDPKSKTFALRSKIESDIRSSPGFEALAAPPVKPVVATPAAAPPPAANAPAANATAANAPAKGGKVATIADIAATVAKSGKSEKEVRAALKAQGYTIK
jgi:hypothetical protein